MKHREEHERQILHEAFLAGWQAALGVYVTHPRVLAIVDTCFEQWLGEAADEAEVLGLMFRGRYDLPGSLLKTPPEQTVPAPASPAPSPSVRVRPAQPPAAQAPPLSVELTYGRTPPTREQDDKRVNGHTTALDESRREPA